MKGVVNDKNGLQSVEIISLSGDIKSKSDAIICRETINVGPFAANGHLFRVEYRPGATFSAGDVIKRAEELINMHGVGDTGYNLLYNNCEHFATYCKTGVAFSKQTGETQT